jgi:hypothetical protein
MQYKLSLYYPLQASSHQVPMAKLLSKNEQSNTQEISRYAQTNPAIKALLTPSNLLLSILFVLCAASLPAAKFRTTVDHPPLALRQALREAFFVRPPPIHTA